MSRRKPVPMRTLELALEIERLRRTDPDRYNRVLAKIAQLAKARAQ